ncbi:hypothetical protein ACQKNX_07835 [Lysinibacillus sp. NPDC093712]|uniref:hypothetical protein n=1 Tax=Lysinibacillus sp. NPDC093712 TaxID=3390579 RepID=UPI003D009655
MRKYQYQVHNDYINLLVTIPIESDEWALKFARRTSLDFYDAKEHHVSNLKVVYICSFLDESVINLNLLSK